MNTKTVACATCGAQCLSSGRWKFCSLACRFASHVDQNGAIPAHRPELGRCAVWTGARDTKGYGQINLANRERRGTHRVAFFLAHGRWPEPMALHKCDNPACVRVDHLFEGDDLDNVRDMLRKGRNGQPHGEDAGMARLTEALVTEIRSAVAKGEPQRAVARRMQIPRTTVGCVVRRQTWKHMA